MNDNAKQGGSMPGNGGSSSATEELSRNLSLALMAAQSQGGTSLPPPQAPAQASVASQPNAQPDKAPVASASGASTATSSSSTNAAATPAPASSRASTTSSSSSASGEEGADSSKPSAAESTAADESVTQTSTSKKKPKKDRSKLRKGKWTVSVGFCDGGVIEVKWCHRWLTRSPLLVFTCLGGRGGVYNSDNTSLQYWTLDTSRGSHATLIPS